MALDASEYDDGEAQSRSVGAGLEAILEEIASVVNSAKTMPLSSSVLIPRDEILSLVDHAIARLPDELKQAKWMLVEREEYLSRVRLDADEILDAARSRAESLVSKTEIVRQATSQANHLLQRAKEEASKLRHEASDYADQTLATLEISLETTLRSVRAGRERLSPTNAIRGGATSTPEKREAEDAFFDQDRG